MTLEDGVEMDIRLIQYTESCNQQFAIEFKQLQKLYIDIFIYNCSACTGNAVTRQYRIGIVNCGLTILYLDSRSLYSTLL